jgi:hypothetical protein
VASVCSSVIGELINSIRLGTFQGRSLAGSGKKLSSTTDGAGIRRDDPPSLAP